MVYVCALWKFVPWRVMWFVWSVIAIIVSADLVSVVALYVTICIYVKKELSSLLAWNSCLCDLSQPY